jgi:hypothetical protein
MTGKAGRKRRNLHGGDYHPRQLQLGTNLIPQTENSGTMEEAYRIGCIIEPSKKFYSNLRENPNYIGLDARLAQEKIEDDRKNPILQFRKT